MPVAFAQAQTHQGSNQVWTWIRVPVNRKGSYHSHQIIPVLWVSSSLKAVEFNYIQLGMHIISCVSNMSQHLWKMSVCTYIHDNGHIRQPGGIPMHHHVAYDAHDITCSKWSAYSIWKRIANASFFYARISEDKMGHL